MLVTTRKKHYALQLYVCYHHRPPAVHAFLLYFLSRQGTLVRGGINQKQPYGLLHTYFAMLALTFGR